MKVLYEENEGYGEPGAGERCRGRCKAKLPLKNPEGWHWCRLKKGHKGPHECVHGAFPPGVEVWRPGHDGGKLVQMLE